MKLNDPIFVAHSGFYLNKRGDIDPLALATVGFIRELDITTARFCLYLLLKSNKPNFVLRKRNSSLIEVRKRDCTLDLYYRKAAIISNSHRVAAQVSTKRRLPVNILVYINSCDD